MPHFVITVVGPDRPGIVDRVASRVAAAHGNWLESRMCRLGGQFAGIIRVDLPAAHAGQLENSLDALAAEQLEVSIVPDAHAPASPPAGDAIALELVGQDRPGIVREISGALARHGVNVEDLHTEVSSAPMSGEPLFHARARICVPPATDLPALRADLERIAHDLMVDLALHPPAPRP